MISNTGRAWIDTDPFIDVDGLKALDLDLIWGISVADGVPSLYGNIYDSVRYPDPLWAQRQLERLDHTDPRVVGFRKIEAAVMSRPGANRMKLMAARRTFLNLAFGSYSGGIGISIRVEDRYENKNLSAHCRDTDNAQYFRPLLTYLDTLPFSEIGRVHMFVNFSGTHTPIHTDGVPGRHRNDMLWLRTKIDKEFFIFDPVTHSKNHVTSHSAFFNEQCWHGSEPSDHMVYSIRVDGVFKPEFREAIGIADLESYN